MIFDERVMIDRLEAGIEKYFAGGEGRERCVRTKFDERKVETRERERDEKEGEGEGERRRESTSEKERKKLFSLPFHSRRCSRFFNRPSPPPPPPLPGV